MNVIGIDPDAGEKGCGVAIYIDGTLRELHMMTIPKIMYLVEGLNKEEVFLNIEDVCANNGNWHSRKQDNKNVVYEKGRCLGRVQQTQEELQRWLRFRNVAYTNTRPSRKNWADSPAVFKAATGWKGISNHDKRAAAYFGYLYKDIKIIPIQKTLAP